jgi:hypothetical protein
MNPGVGIVEGDLMELFVSGNDSLYLGRVGHGDPDERENRKDQDRDNQRGASLI